MTDAYQAEMQRVIALALQRRAAVIDERCRELAPGETLCVHDMPTSGLPRIVVSARRLHVLVDGETCDEPVRREQYGPAPANWRDIVADQLR